MKKIVFALLVACIVYSPAVHAQFSKGKTLVGLSSRMGLMGLSDLTLGNMPNADIFSLGFSSIKIKSDMDGYEEPDPDKIRAGPGPPW